MSNKNLIDEVIEKAPNRRSFLSKLAIASAAVAATGGLERASAQGTALTDADILNFALNLEYLEAEFYTVATTGKTIDQMGIGITGSGASGPTTGGALVALPNNSVMTSTVANQIAFDERQHVSFIRSALTAAGATPVAKPAINLNALGAGFGAITDFLVVARALEDIGVTAFGGAAPLITDKAILGAAARIALTEGEHAANIRLQIAVLGIPTTLLDGVDILPPPSGQNFFSVDNNALTQVRTPGQVLFLAYGGQANATSGGFYPNGVNGTINTSSAGVPIMNQTVAAVSPSTITTNQSSLTLDASTSVSAAGALTYFFSVAPGGLTPAILQTMNNPKAIIQFVGGPGLYNLLLTVTDANGKTSTAPIALTYKP